MIQKQTMTFLYTPQNLDVVVGIHIEFKNNPLALGINNNKYIKVFVLNGLFKLTLRNYN